MIATVAVDVALRRPPRVDRTLFYLLPVDGESYSALVAVELFACQWAASRPGVVMPVGSRIVDLVDDG